ncbi:MAG: hypothetical protein AAF989_04170 [Planctomycetota bacterium]
MNSPAPNSPAPAADRFWFPVIDEHRLRLVRMTHVVIAGLYFISCFPDASVWFGDRGWIGGRRLAEFIDAADLGTQVRAYVSPLWLFESLNVVQLTLLWGGALSAVVIAVDFFRRDTWLRIVVPALWLTFLSVANRYLMLAGPTEALLSLSLFVIVIASLPRTGSSWVGLGVRVLSLQWTIVSAAVTLGTLRSQVWWDGTGAFALAEPTGLRAVDWTQGVLNTTWVHDTLTLMLAFALPVGAIMVWIPTTRRLGIGLALLWSVLLAAIGSRWIDGMVMAAGAVTFTTLREPSRDG